MNHLIHEKSPYLLQHTENPVDWYPWGEEAFRRAANEDKPVFLSIGYSTCHWCHVMAHESFEDPEVAELLNRDYICIKVDREERPDVDAVYMAVCQAVTGSGGWPLTVILAPDQKPFFAGTYFPKRSMAGRPGLMELLPEIAKLYRTRREELQNAGTDILNFITREAGTAPQSPDKNMVSRAVSLLGRDYDKVWGGFGSAPKFPVPHNLLFLLRYAVLEGDRAARGMAEHTLSCMAAGGIFDQIGGGFSRYATDDKWLIPHFEKMLYDNALLSAAYLEAYQVTGEVFFADTAKRTLHYIMRELTGHEGEFFCGQDADSEGVEGKYYYFTPDEIKRIFREYRPGTDRKGVESHGKEVSSGRNGLTAEWFCKAFNISEAGNFEGYSVPNRIGHQDPLPEGTEGILKMLYDYRKKRTVLHLDDKAILSWNAWAIAAMAKAARILGDDSYLEAAKAAEHFISARMVDSRDRLYLRFRDGEAAHTGHLDDYAVYGLALLSLYEATFEPQYLKAAVQRAGQMVSCFEDVERGGYFLTASDAEQLITRRKETYDGALPSGNSAAAVLLGRLARYTGGPGWKEASERQNRYLTGVIRDEPYGHSYGLIALMEELYPSKELICASADGELPSELEQYLRRNPGHQLTVLLKTNKNGQELASLVPFTKDYPVPEQGCTYYLCSEGKCRLPEREFEKLGL